MQTHEWEELLDGTTPGPWEVYSEDSIMVLDADNTVAVLDLDERYLTHNLKDVEVAATAPTAVAEVVRLRKAIAELAEQERATADDEFYPVHLRYLCGAYADDLTRILEGDTDD